MIRWRLFPSNLNAPQNLVEIIRIFEANQEKIVSVSSERQPSDDVLAKIRDDLQKLGFQVEEGRAKAQKVKVPVLYGENGKVLKAFEVDAYHPQSQTVLEVEAGRAVVNNQFLKDFFEACVMPTCTWCCIAVRNVYRNQDDYKSVCTFFESLFTSQRLVLPIKGVLIIGY
jgi:hypothetical protein